MTALGSRFWLASLERAATRVLAGVQQRMLDDGLGDAESAQVDVLFAPQIGDGEMADRIGIIKDGKLLIEG